MVKEKQIDPSGILHLVKESLDSVITDHYESGPLPKGCIYYAVVERNSQHPEQIVIIEREACIRPYNHMGEIYQVGYPKLIFCYKVIKDKICGFYMAAVKDEIINKKSEVYHFPYANVYDNGSVCMGSFIHPPIKELSDLTYYPEAFYTIEHTHLMNARNQLIIDILKEVENKPFDSGLLVFDCTFEQFISRISGIRKKLKI
ncbi:MAG: hypothetical protein A4E52_00743 [Pelotomaculum sp. PtaB.Bin013]|nr:MAG: hypothetical protein A4E52_00743 [Pelotomaculum sp. PtaB.Bin013]